LGYAQEAGNHWYGDKIYAVKNLDEFISSPFEDVVQANTGGFLKTEAYGGVELYQKDRQKKRTQMEIELKEFRKRSESNSSNNKKS